MIIPIVYLLDRVYIYKNPLKMYSSVAPKIKTRYISLGLSQKNPKLGFILSLIVLNYLCKAAYLFTTAKLQPSSLIRSSSKT